MMLLKFAIYCLSLNVMAWKHKTCLIKKSNPGHMHKAAIEKKNRNNFCQSVQKQHKEKQEKENKKCYCITRKHSKYQNL